MVARAEGLSFKKRLRLLALVLAGAKLVRLAEKQRWSHVHVHSCADAANVALFAHLIGDIDYSFTLHGPLEDYGPNQKQKWAHAAFAIVITKKLLAEVQEKLAGSLPPAIEIAYSEFKTLVREGRVAEVTLSDHIAQGTLTTVQSLGRNGVASGDSPRGRMVPPGNSGLPPP